MQCSNLRFPEDLSMNVTSYPEFCTYVQTCASGAEQRIMQLQEARYSYEINVNIANTEDRNKLISFFMIHQGRGISFLFKDWSDYKALNQELKYLGNHQYQLVKRYSYGDISYVRNITRPKNGTITVYQADNIVQAEIDYNTGVVLVHGLNDDVPLHADFEFDVRVRFNSDVLAISNAVKDLDSINIEIIEVR